ncbi:MAG TPA: ABC transporter substrate-binding protein [Nocardioides sp.]|mgnify:FL=1|nr:carbohydrate ABC transporter substrate-binding protein [Nocardioides sp.]HRD62718.1 ABC transporter substrate-binding protein [Nocardioides sp.]HRI95690.1 ABC transporter substrate-binding protein [Nocardioides sp.]HRK45680.1 ABC transporter substrate-binding protein [Nocardioides sp.]
MAVATRRRLGALGLAVGLGLAMSGCLQDPDEGGGGGSGGTAGFADNSSSDGDGKVTILGAYGGDEKANFEKALAPFEKESGIDIEYTEDSDFTTTIKTRVAAGDAPDIGFFPQPGGLLELAATGDIQPIDTFLDIGNLQKTLVPGLLESTILPGDPTGDDAVAGAGRMYGAPMRLANKSLVWYPKKAWDAAGYKAPTTLEELTALEAQIRESGITPWCMAWNADQATGWVGTDWIEQMVLSLYGPDVYNEWTSHAIPFNDPQIVGAFDEFAKIAKTDGQVYGGVQTVVNTQVAESMVPAFRNPPECMLERQGSFEISFLPAKIQADLDNEVGVFPFPAKEASAEAPPILGGADLAALFNGNDPDAIEVMQFLTSDKFGAEWAQAGGWLSPHKTFDPANYPNQTTKDIAAAASGASQVVFDGSDVMPKEVGSGTFWTGMVEWIQGKSSEDTTADIEASWPQ